MATLAGDPLSEEMWGFGGTVLAQQGTVGVAQVELQPRALPLVESPALLCTLNC